jgi:hypothetical protein
MQAVLAMKDVPIGLTLIASAQYLAETILVTLYPTTFANALTLELSTRLLHLKLP